MFRLALISLVLIATAALAEDETAAELRLVERWKCFSPIDYGKEKVLVEALRYEIPEEMAVPFKVGDIHVAGQEYRAIFAVEGFNRIWFFGPQESLEEDKTPVFKFLINPDGSGYYYDFSDVGEGEATTPSQTFKCVDK